MRGISRLLLALLFLSLAAGPLGGGRPALATYPGSENGRLAFGLRYGDNVDIVSVLPDGRSLRRLTTAPSFDACPSYSPDGKQIAFCSDRGGNTEIWTMKANGSRQRQLTRTGGRLTFPDYSPDGRRVAFSGSLPGEATVDIFSTDADGGDLRRLTVAPGRDSWPVYSPDGGRIAFISDRSGINQVWAMDADGGNQTQLTFDLIAKNQLPDWSPDGSRIAYEAGGDLYAMGADGSDQRRLTSGLSGESGPAWSPDGTQIAFLRDDGTPERWVHVMDADGSNQRPVYASGTQYVPAWQPRGVPVRYTITDLGGPGAVGRYLNDEPRVTVNVTASGGVSRAFLWEDGRLRELGTPGGGFSAGFGVSERGHVAGRAQTASGAIHASVWYGGTMTDLGTLGGPDSEGIDVNSRGQVAGLSATADGRTRAVLWHRGEARDLGTLGGPNARANGVNDRGEVVGRSETTRVDPGTGRVIQRAYVWRNGKMRDLGVLPGAPCTPSFPPVGGVVLCSVGIAIADKGYIAGWAQGADGVDHAVRWNKDREIEDLGFPVGFAAARGFGVNSSGEVVGDAFPSAGTGGTPRAIVSRDGERPFDLNTLIPAGSGWVLTGARGINNRGQIAGHGLLNGQPHAFLLTPMED